jgi:hypothetical protein
MGGKCCLERAVRGNEWYRLDFLNGGAGTENNFAWGCKKSGADTTKAGWVLFVRRDETGHGRRSDYKIRRAFYLIDVGAAVRWARLELYLSLCVLGRAEAMESVHFLDDFKPYGYTGSGYEAYTRDVSGRFDSADGNGQ